MYCTFASISCVSWCFREESRSGRGFCFQRAQAISPDRLTLLAALAPVAMLLALISSQLPANPPLGWRSLPGRLPAKRPPKVARHVVSTVSSGSESQQLTPEGGRETRRRRLATGFSFPPPALQVAFLNLRNVPSSRRRITCGTQGAKREPMSEAKDEGDDTNGKQERSCGDSFKRCVADWARSGRSFRSKCAQLGPQCRGEGNNPGQPSVSYPLSRTLVPLSLDLLAAGHRVIVQGDGGVGDCDVRTADTIVSKSLHLSGGEYGCKQECGITPGGLRRPQRHSLGGVGRRLSDCSNARRE